MAAGTVVSGGFPGRIAQEVNPNQKCGGCLHYDGQAGRTGACTIGWQPWNCGDGDAAEIGYAPIGHGAGSYLPDMSNHGAHAPEVETQFVSDMYGAGSTRPIHVQQVSLGEEHVHFVKSMVDDHAQFQRSMCRQCQSRGAIGTAPANVEPQVCSCSPIAAREVAKALAPRLSNLARSVMTFDDVVAFVYDVAKAGFKLPLEKASFYHQSGRYDVSPGGSGSHHVDFHPHGGGESARVGTFSSPRAARHGASSHAQRFAEGSGKTSPSTQAPTRQIKTAPGLPSMRGAVSVAKKGGIEKADTLKMRDHSMRPGHKVVDTPHGNYHISPKNTVRYSPNTSHPMHAGADPRLNHDIKFANKPKSKQEAMQHVSEHHALMTR
jgi:hypothetical protein